METEDDVCVCDDKGTHGVVLSDCQSDRVHVVMLKFFCEVDVQFFDMQFNTLHVSTMQNACDKNKMNVLRQVATLFACRRVSQS